MLIPNKRTKSKKRIYLTFYLKKHEILYPPKQKEMSLPNYHFLALTIIFLVSNINLAYNKIAEVVSPASNPNHIPELL